MSEQRERDFQMPDVTNLEPEPPDMEKQILWRVSATPGSGTTASAATSTACSRWACRPAFTSRISARRTRPRLRGDARLSRHGSRGRSQQGGEPGDVYVIEPDPKEISPIEDGEAISPHGMDPQTVLRFVKTVHGWPGKVVVVGCEPADVESVAMERSEPVKAAVDRAAAVVLDQLNQLQSDAAYGPS
jgi:hypothetical protein